MSMRASLSSPLARFFQIRVRTAIDAIHQRLDIRWPETTVVRQSRQITSSWQTLSWAAVPSLFRQY